MKLKFDGKGNSKENAIRFENAMTFDDHIEMQREYIEQNNLEVTGVRSVGSVKDRYIYDVYETQNGSLWFKVPNNFIE